MQLCEHSWRERPAWKRLHHRCRGRPLAASREQRAASGEILRAAGLHQEAQMIWAGHQRGHIKERQHFKSSALTFMTSVYARSCTLTSTSFTFFLPFFLSFSSGSKGRMCQIVMYLVCWSPEGIFFSSSSFFFFSFSSSSSQRFTFYRGKFFFSLLTPIKSFFQCSL